MQACWNAFTGWAGPLAGGMMGRGILGMGGVSFLTVLAVGYLFYILLKQSFVKTKESALDLLEKEFAKGVITEEEFIRRKQILTS